MSISNISSFNNSEQVPEKVDSSAVPLKYKEIPNVIKDCASLLLYSRDESVCKTIFQGKELVKTKNSGKVSQVVSIVLQNRNPISASDTRDGYAQFFLEPAESEMVQHSNGEGHCEGGVAWFFKRMEDLGDPQSVAKEFQEGLPKEAIYIQTLYDNIGEMDIDGINRLLDNPYTLFSEGEMSLNRKAAQHIYRTKDKLQLIRDQYAFSLVGLNIEKKLCFNDTGEKLLEQMSSGLEDGYYAVSVPCFSSQGEKEGRHILGFYLTGEKVYFFDPNYAIGVFEKAEIGELSERILTNYSGVTFKDGKEQPFSLKGWLKNRLQGKSNPPYRGEVGKEYVLFKVGTGPSYNGL